MTIDFATLFWLENALITAGVMFALNARWGNWSDEAEQAQGVFAIGSMVVSLVFWPAVWAIGVVALVVSGIRWIASPRAS